MEIEKKWLVDNLPDLTGIEMIQIRQGYLRTGDPEERIREKISGGKMTYVRTIKSGSGLCREETEVDITAAEFAAEWDKTAGHRIEKVRYKIPYNGLVIELDIYGKNNTGLKVAEVEFASTSQASEFTPPEWFGQDVTKDARYKNKNLAG